MPKHQVVKQTAHEVRAEAFMGPLPPPNILANYEQICPGFAERILAMAEKEAASRQELEKRNLEIAGNDVVNARNETRRGQWLSFCLTVIAFSVAVTCAWLNQPWVAGIVAGTTLASVVSTIMRRN